MIAAEKWREPTTSQTTGPAEDPGLSPLLAFTRDPAVDAVLRAQALSDDEWAPDFSLPDTAGVHVSLDALLARGTVVLAFVHGAWCRTCVQLARHMATALADLGSDTTTLAILAPMAQGFVTAISPAPTGRPLVLDDSIAHVGSLYGLLLPIPERVRPLLQDCRARPILMDDGTPALIVPATYVVARNGLVTLAQLDPDHVLTSATGAVVAELRRLGT